ncbi:sigma-54-dependent Fis family transcriptional regulator [Ferrimonas balearica]|uniref:sigma-54-dependent Fis family transcriptional regulator n=1 Tax=Ferrimonas balearica TaxID=44012 RepID=UPI001C591884|nr:sigma-54-dependent Fis family transcriptional regulator [Ferrimonas balearica]MBW3139671.1 sigma-54-dependent Fis family transcriptional regulator [Ferrimonas balearica]MBW3164697.1 sigma-54-dependent Fis family transcriptional regulator [Ferrimonas balearica]MBY6107223.1 sigma-54-dependent Fis family transcriptional regulator [Ferrimonas balearica]
MSLELSLYREVTQTLSSSLQIETALKACFAELQPHFPADGIYINLFLPASQEIQSVAVADANGAKQLDRRIALTEEMCQLLQDPDRPLVRILTDVHQDPVTYHVLSQVLPQARSVVQLRLKIDDTHLGVAALYATKEGAFNNRHAELFRQFKAPFSLVTAFNLQSRNMLADNAHLASENRALRRSIAGQDEVVGARNGLKTVMEQVEAIAPLESTVLITGQTGVGKEVIANAIHQRSSRTGKPFIKVNCGAIPDSLIDSELFGYEKGAFTGAEKRKQGYFEQANGGTIFLDELGELPLSAQVRLLRVLQNRTIVRVGGVEPVELDIRVVAATHRDLAQMVQTGDFREDLWYRLNVFPIDIPGLNQRRQDIPLLVHHFMEQLAPRLGFKQLPAISGEDMMRLQNHAWPGNVRELVNAVERAMIQSRGGPLDFRFLSCPVAGHAIPENDGERPVIIDPSHATDMLVPLDVMTAKYMEHALRLTGGKIHGPGGAAERLKIHPNTLRSRMKKLGLL